MTTAAANLTVSSKISARRLANAAARREKDANRKCNKIMAKVISGASVTQFCAAEDDFTIDKHGRKVRTSAPTDKEIAHALTSNRVMDSTDILELLGEAAFTKLVTNGSLKRDASFNRYRTCNLYWITKKAAELYGIPAIVTLAGGAQVALAD